MAWFLHDIPGHALIQYPVFMTSHAVSPAIGWKVFFHHTVIIPIDSVS